MLASGITAGIGERQLGVGFTHSIAIDYYDQKLALIFSR
jgi:hypothetical protein